MNGVPNQKELVFFGRGEIGPSLDERERAVSRSNPTCPLNLSGAPERILQPLRERAVAALGRRNHCEPFSLVLHGDSANARRLVQGYAAAIQLPYVGCTGYRIKSVNDLLVRIASVCEVTTFQNAGGSGTLELVPVLQPNRPERFGGSTFLVIPPCVVLVRDVDRLNCDVLHRLRIAAEGDEPVLYAAEWSADTFRVAWFFHSREQVDLPDELEGFPLLGVLS